ncbi:hypothetical protein CWD77_02285 [Rhodohalobacter barkolensis]|uniref:Uncharacterized protein n=1 Tax=Rhodohalobacter barkolensis TaxID=2053187 RepID=A0A2N0VJE6_9BACT|nr:hypothetical protein CWD77_02285 [Rhodohalobacter barkolensis]
MSGIVLFTILPIDNHVGDDESSLFVSHDIEYESVDEPEEKDSKHPSDFLDLTFKETPEKKESSIGFSSLAILKQGITASEIGIIKLILDRSYYLKRAGQLSIDYSLAFINKPVNHVSLPFHILASSIAINAP